jgi:hypothetical protein
VTPLNPDRTVRLLSIVALLPHAGVSPANACWHFEALAICRAEACQSMAELLLMRRI